MTHTYAIIWSISGYKWIFETHRDNLTYESIIELAKHDPNSDSSEEETVSRERIRSNIKNRSIIFINCEKNIKTGKKTVKIMMAAI